MKQTAWLTIALLVIFAVLFGFARKFSVKETSSGPLRVGAVLPLSGPVAGLGEAMRAGYTWKIEELNRQNRLVAFYLQDSQSNPKDATSAFLKLVDVEKVPIIFTTMSSVSMALKPIAEDRSALLWADAAHPDITTDSKFVLRHSNIAGKDAEVIGSKALELGAKTVGLLYQNDDWGTAATKALTQVLGKGGVPVIADAVDLKSSDLRPQLTKLIKQNADTLVTVVAGAPAGLIIKQARELGFRGNIISSVGIVLTPDAQKLAGPHLYGTYYQTYDANSSFEADYRTRFSAKPAAFTHVAYTDMEILIAAIDATGTVDPVQIARYVKALRTFKGKYETVEITSDGDIIVPTVIKKF